MLRFIVLSIAILVGVAWLTRSTRARQAVWTILVVLAVYAVLKLTGVIEDIAPSRAPVLGYQHTPNAAD
ncbi:hypothetical protein [Amaricoccus sp.]|uniref:hypothetical protein n=1 Tax=Amaricoccus sp. TaxID=1872485 RepID=UPI001B5F0A9D|nr:hypothetical protein [Amaricoccus sp.]MBP7242256.1 hypothetical protein [Amaricoccus sp.]